MYLSPILLSLKLAFVTTLVLFPTGLIISYFLFQQKGLISKILNAIITLPIILPPTVLGFYLLVVLAPSGIVGRFLNNFNISLLFSFNGLVFASVIYNLPFMIFPLLNGFQSISKTQSIFLKTLKRKPIKDIYLIYLPQMKSSVASAIILTFAHTISEFGVLLMIGGNATKSTQVASIAIYQLVEKMDYEGANKMSFYLILISLFIIIGLQYINNGPLYRFKMDN